MPRKNEQSERTCIVTRQEKPVDALIRFVAAPDGTLVPDIRRKLPGRGVWVTASTTALTEAVKRRLFEKAFDGKVTVAPDLVDQVDRLLLAAATGALSLARKAGSLVGGFGKVESALASERVAGLIHAREAGSDGIAKLAAAARRSGQEKPPVIRCFSGTDLDLAFGRTNVIHAALLAGPASDNVLARVGDLVGYRGGDDLLDGAPKFDALTGTE